MGRRKATPENADGGDAAPPSHNGPKDEDIVHHLEIICAAKDTWDNLAAKARSAQAEYRDAVKAAKGAGLNSDAISDVVKWRKADPDEVLARQKAAVRYAVLLELDVGEQMGLFDDDTKKPDAYSIAIAEGILAGRAGVGKLDDVNKYNANSNKEEERRRAEGFAHGWAIGQGKLGQDLWGPKGQPAITH